VTARAKANVSLNGLVRPLCARYVLDAPCERVIYFYPSVCN
jgi:hypothetical protein